MQQKKLSEIINHQSIITLESSSIYSEEIFFKVILFNPQTETPIRIEEDSFVKRYVNVQTYQNTYIFSEPTNKLFYIRNQQLEYIKLIDIENFKKQLNAIMITGNIKYLFKPIANEQLQLIITSNGGTIPKNEPEKISREIEMKNNKLTLQLHTKPNQITENTAHDNKEQKRGNYDVSTPLQHVNFQQGFRNFQVNTLGNQHLFETKPYDEQPLQFQFDEEELNSNKIK